MKIKILVLLIYAFNFSVSSQIYNPYGRTQESPRYYNQPNGKITAVHSSPEIEAYIDSTIVKNEYQLGIYGKVMDTVISKYGNEVLLIFEHKKDRVFAYKHIVIDYLDRVIQESSFYFDRKNGYPIQTNIKRSAFPDTVNLTFNNYKSYSSCLKTFHDLSTNYLYSDKKQELKSVKYWIKPTVKMDDHRLVGLSFNDSTDLNKIADEFSNYSSIRNNFNHIYHQIFHPDWSSNRILNNSAIEFIDGERASLYRDNWWHNYYDSIESLYPSFYDSVTQLFEKGKFKMDSLIKDENFYEACNFEWTFENSNPYLKIADYRINPKYYRAFERQAYSCQMQLAKKNDSSKSFYNAISHYMDFPIDSFAQSGLEFILTQLQENSNLDLMKSFGYYKREKYQKALKIIPSVLENTDPLYSYVTKLRILIDQRGEIDEALKIARLYRKNNNLDFSARIYRTILSYYPDNSKSLRKLNSIRRKLDLKNR